MKILNRYLFRELSSSMFLGFVVFTFLLFLNNLLYLIDLLVSRHTPLLTVLRLTVYFVVLLVPFTVPIAVLFGILLTYGRFTQDNEIVVLRSAGISTVRFVWQPVFIAVMLTVLVYFTNMYVIPLINTSFREVYIGLIHKQSSIKFEDKTYMQLMQYKVYINKVDKKTNNLIGISIYKLDNIATRIFAQEGKAKVGSAGELVFTLNDGVIQKSLPSSPGKLTHFTFKIYKIAIPMETSIDLSSSRTIKDYSSRELVSEMKLYKSKHMPTTYLETEYFTRWANSFAALCFCVIGIPLAIKIHRSTKSLGAGISLGVITVYYFIFISSVTLAERNVMAPRYAMWLSNLAVLLPGIYLNIRLFQK